MPEGDPGSYKVWLNSRPTANVTVRISGHSETDLRVTDTTFTFNPVNYGTAQSVNVRAVHDTGCSNDSITLDHSASGGGYDDESGSLPVTIVDDDSNCDPPPPTVRRPVV